MKIAELANRLKIASEISNPSSLTSLYRAIHLDNGSVRCCSEFGNLYMLADTGIKDPILLDCQSIASIIQSLPRDGNITFEEKTNKLQWSCGSAKGHLNHVQTDYKVPEIVHQTYPWIPPKDFGRAIRLAATSCGAGAVSCGLYGISIELIDGKLVFMSSDAHTLSRATIDAAGYQLTEKIVVRPPVPDIIETLLANDECSMDFTPTGIHIVGNWTRAELPTASNLEHDLNALAAQFIPATKVIQIESDAIKKFVQRAKNLAESKTDFKVILKIESGKLLLEHKAIASSTEEYFLAKGLPEDVNYSPVSLEAARVLDAMQNIDTLVLDHLSSQKVVLKGSNPDFMFVVGGN